MMQLTYGARFDREPDGGILVTFPDLPEAITEGADMAEARANAIDALSTALRGRVDDGRALPEPAARGPGLVPVSPDPETALKVAFIVEFERLGITKTELARRIGKVESEARRILDPNHATKLGAMRSAFAAIGKEIVVSVRDAA